MIKVLLNGTPVYGLEFQRRVYSHAKSKGKDPSKRQPLYETTALIYMADAKRDEPPVAKATARQHHKDRYSPEASRKAALKALLRPNILQYGTGAPPFSRIERTAIWKAYWNRKNTQLKPLPPSGAGSIPARTGVSAFAHRIVNKVTNPSGLRIVA